MLNPSEYDEQIRQLAYERFVARGFEEGHELEDWFIAEQQFLRESSVEANESHERNVAETPSNLVIEKLPQRND